MYSLNQFTTNAKQQITLQLEDNQDLVLYFEYKSNQLGWFFGFRYQDQEYQNIRLTTSYNILRAYKNWLPFGIICTTLDGFEPMDKTDLYTGYAKIGILTKKEVAMIESVYYAKATA